MREGKCLGAGGLYWCGYGLGDGFGFSGLYLAGVGEACPGLYGTGETLYGEGVGVGET